MSKTATKPTPEPILDREPEVQRQHIRIQLPAAVKIGKQTYEIVDLSAGGFSIRVNNKFALSKDAEEVRILFPFESFSFHLKAKAGFVYLNKEKNIIGFRFQEAGKRQASLLNHIIKSYFAGQSSAGQDLIVAASSEDMAGNDNEAETGALL